MTTGRAVATIAAVDLGASSGRVLIGSGQADHFEMHEVHRFANDPVRANGALRWDIRSLFRELVEGLRIGVAEFGQLDSIGVDSWGVDYGLLDGAGELIDDPVHYRDPRTANAVDEILADIGPVALYEATGTQLQSFNTLFQLRADVDTGRVEPARYALLIPDLISYWLTGELGTEMTNASTTGLFDPRASDWSYSLAARAQVPLGLFPPLRRPGASAGTLRPQLAAIGRGSAQPPVLVVPSHDTAAAVAGIPSETGNFAYVCTGTWALVGLELAAPITTETSRVANFTNEVGVDGTIRFLRNVTGFWLLQECVRTWTASGQRVSLAELSAQAEAVPGLRAIIDVQDPSFAAPGDMPARIAAAAQITSGSRIASPAQVCRCILDSMALAVRHAVRDAAELAQRPVDVVHVVGGGVSNELFCQLVADACDRPVEAGPAEAASWGNVLTQARAIGVVGDSLTEARAVIAASVGTRTYWPAGVEPDWQRADQLIAARRVSRL